MLKKEAAVKECEQARQELNRLAMDKRDKQCIKD